METTSGNLINVYNEKYCSPQKAKNASQHSYKKNIYTKRTNKIVYSGARSLKVTDIAWKVDSNDIKESPLYKTRPSYKYMQRTDV